MLWQDGPAGGEIWRGRIPGARRSRPRRRSWAGSKRASSSRPARATATSPLRRRCGSRGCSAPGGSRIRSSSSCGSAAPGSGSSSTACGGPSNHGVR